MKPIILSLCLIISLGTVCWADPPLSFPQDQNLNLQPKSGTPKINPHVILQPQGIKGNPSNAKNVPLMDPKTMPLPDSLPINANSQNDPLVNIYQHGLYRKRVTKKAEPPNTKLTETNYFWSVFNQAKGYYSSVGDESLYALAGQGVGFPATGIHGLSPTSKWEWELIADLKTNAEVVEKFGTNRTAQLDDQDHMFFDLLALRGRWELVHCSINYDPDDMTMTPHRITDCIFRRQVRASEIPH